MSQNSTEPSNSQSKSPTKRFFLKNSLNLFSIFLKDENQSTDIDQLNLIDNLLTQFEVDSPKLSSQHIDTNKESLKCSTPLASNELNKEFELLNELYETGDLNDASQKPSGDLSPIIASNRAKGSKLGSTRTSKNLLKDTLKHNTYVSNQKPMQLNFEESQETKENRESQNETRPHSLVSSKSDSAIQDLDKATNLNQGKNFDSLQKLSDMGETNFGFSTAKGVSIKIKAESIEKANKILMDVDSEAPVSAVTDSVGQNGKAQGGFMGFSTASGAKIAVSEKAINKAKEIIGSIDLADSGPVQSDLKKSVSVEPMETDSMPKEGNFKTKIFLFVNEMKILKYLTSSLNLFLKQVETSI